MTPTTPQATEAAREIWARALGKAAPEEIGPIAEQVFAELRTGLSRWIGAEGFRALFARATTLAQAEHPDLGIQSLDGAGTVTAAGSRQGAEHATAVLVAQLAAAIDLLGRIVGEEMGMQLVNQAAVSAPRAPGKKVGGGPNG
jgi:hypothetical protein